MPGRFHKGITAMLRHKMRLMGLQIDEETAQKVLGGATAAQKWSREVGALVDEVKTERFTLMRVWEEHHPGRNAYPEPFAQRALAQISKAINALDPTEKDVEPNAKDALRVLRAFSSDCISELHDDVNYSTEEAG
jgi:hypothetical protein